MGATPFATGAGGSGGGGSGTVTSVAMTVPTELAVSGSPISTVGTLVLTWQSVAANRVFAGPDGAGGTPSFRALVAADLPDLSGTYAALSHNHAASAITSGTLDAARIPWGQATGDLGYYGSPGRPWVWATRVYASDGFYGDAGLNFVAASGQGVSIWSNDVPLVTFIPSYLLFNKKSVMSLSTSGTDDWYRAVTISRETSDVPQQWFGVEQVVQLEAPGGGTFDSARQVVYYNDASASYQVDVIQYVRDYAGEREIWHGRANGSAAAIGLLGASPVPRAAHIADPSGGATVDADARTTINAILVVLENIGLVAMS